MGTNRDLKNPGIMDLKCKILVNEEGKKKVQCIEGFLFHVMMRTNNYWLTTKATFRYNSQGIHHEDRLGASKIP